MTDEQRFELAKALGGETGIAVFDGYVAGEIEAIEPIIDRYIREAKGDLMPLPNSRETLKAAGYTLESSKQCSCGQMIEMYKTPKNRMMPWHFFERNGQEIAEPHIATCPHKTQYSERLRQAEEKKKDLAKPW